MLHYDTIEVSSGIDVNKHMNQVSVILLLLSFFR